MKQKPLLWGMDQLVLKQEVTPTPACKILYKFPSLTARLRAHGFPLRGWSANGGKTKLRFEHVDLNFWRQFGKFHLEAWPSSESLALAPRAAWENAQELYVALGLILGFEARPLVMSFDLFVDVVHLWVSMSLLSRIKNMRGLKKWSDPDLGGRSAIYGRPKRFGFYDKLLESTAKPSKRYVQTAWREAGWDGSAPVCRIDMRFKMTPEVRALPLDLGSLRDAALSLVVLTRRRRLPGRRASVRMEDPLWTSIRALEFTKPWRAPPSTLPATTRSLRNDARQATSAAWWSLASLLVIDAARPDLLDPWARKVAEMVRRSHDLRDGGFAEKLADRADVHELPVPAPAPRYHPASWSSALEHHTLPPHPHLIMGSVKGGLCSWGGRPGLSDRAAGHLVGPIVGHLQPLQSPVRSGATELALA